MHIPARYPGFMPPSAQAAGALQSKRMLLPAALLGLAHGLGDAAAGWLLFSGTAAPARAASLGGLQPLLLWPALRQRVQSAKNQPPNLG